MNSEQADGLQNQIRCSRYRERRTSENEKIMEHQSKLDLDNVPVPTNFKDLIRILNETFTDEFVNVEYITKLLSNYKSNPKDWRQYAKTNPSIPYTRNLIDDGNGKYNILLLVWNESQGSPIHDHSNSHCFMKGLDGELLETRYEWPAKTTDDCNNNVEGQEMVVKSSAILTKDIVTYMNDDIGLHRVENKSHTTPAVSLHVYIPPYSECQKFDEQTGKAQTVKITFYSVNDEKVIDG